MKSDQALHVAARRRDAAVPIAALCPPSAVLLRKTSPAFADLYWSRLKRMSIPVVLLVLLTACAPSNTTRVKADRPLTAEEKRIVEIARRTVVTNAAWVSNVEFQIPRKDDKGGWSVFVWKLPASPGGFRIITIDEKERVTGDLYGY